MHHHQRLLPSKSLIPTRRLTTQLYHRRIKKKRRKNPAPARHRAQTTLKREWEKAADDSGDELANHPPVNITVVDARGSGPLFARDRGIGSAKPAKSGSSFARGTGNGTCGNTGFHCDYCQDDGPTFCSEFEMKAHERTCSLAPFSMAQSSANIGKLNSTQASPNKSNARNESLSPMPRVN